MKCLSILPLLSVLLFASVATADGLIIVQPKPRELVVQMGVKYHRVDAVIDNQVAKTTIDQVFTNPNNRVIEGTYIFPLPEDAGIRDFSMFMNGKEVKGEVLDKDKALAVYQQIVSQMKDPALLEYAGRGMFKARIFPIPAKGEVRTKIAYTQTLVADNKLVRYVYPLNTEKFSSTPLEDVAVRVRIKSKFPIKNVYSPSHVADVARPSDSEAVVGYEQKHVKPDKDFVVYYAVDDKDIGLNLITFRESPGQPGHFLMLISPSLDTAKISRKDVTFIFDTSGSMSGPKIEQAKKALKFCLNSLNTNDRFRIVRFSTDVSLFADKMVPATRAKVNEAITFVDKFQATGGTNIGEALKHAFGVDRGKEAPAHMMIFLTDGLPTVGQTDPAQLIAQVKQANGEGSRSRLFGFGVGFDVNTRLLDELAMTTKAASEYVTPKEDIEVKVSALYGKISSPVLSNVTLTTGNVKGVRIEDMYPKQLPDIFKGTQLVILGRYTGHGPAAIRLKGRTDEGQKEFIYESTFAERDMTAEDVPFMWANAKVSYLIDQIRLRGETKEVREEIVRLSKEYGIVTPYTSVIVLEDGDANVGEARRTNVLSDVAKKSQMMTELRKRAATARSERESLETAVGQKAVSNAAQNAYQGKEGLGREGKKVVGVEADSDRTYLDFEQIAKRYQKRVLNRSFFLTTDDDAWVEDGITDEELAKAHNVKYLSDEYFALLRANPRLGKLMAQGQKVSFRHAKQVIQVR